MKRAAKAWYRHWWALAAAAVGLTIIVGYSWYRTELRPAGSGPAQVFVVAPGTNAPKVASALHDARLIRNRNAFLTYMNFHGLRGLLKAGSYSIAPSESSPQIAAILTRGDSSLGELVIPEGYTIKQIEAAAAKRGIATSDFEAALAAPHSQAILATKPAGVSLEGYLFPDSYQIIPGTTTASSLVTAMLGDFAARVGTTYNQAFAAEGLSLHQGLTLASIIEKEVSRPSDRPIVAQVFLKRLKLGIPLGSDVTVDYAASLLGTTFNTGLNSPYNTYLHAGLPLGPICNPGLSSLDAVAHPAATDYLYFVAGTDGVTHFATTYAQHQQNIAKYMHE
jgi:UPF0755 protein